MWAYAQVKRDGWHPPILVSASPEPGNYKEPQNVVLSGPAGCRISYTAEGMEAEAAAVNAAANGAIYIDKSTNLRVIASSGGRQDEYLLSYTISMEKADYEKNEVDGNPSEWVTDSILVTGKGKTHNLSAKTDRGNLYVMVTGSQLDQATELCLYIDTTQSAISGFRDMGWSNAGIDYLVSNGDVKKYAGTGSDFLWEEVGKASFSRTASCAEWAIPLRTINRTVPLPLNIGFARDYGDHAPMFPNKMAEVHREKYASKEYVTLAAMQALGWQRAREFAYSYDDMENKTLVTNLGPRQLVQGDIDELNWCLESYGITDPNVICHLLIKI